MESAGQLDAVTVNVALRPPTLSVASTMPPGREEARVRTQTVCPSEIVPISEINVFVQPIEYSVPLMGICGTLMPVIVTALETTYAAVPYGTIAGSKLNASG